MLSIDNLPEYACPEKLGEELVYKYILAKVSNEDGDEKYVVRVTRPNIDHGSSLATLEREAAEFKVSSFGGGRIQFKPRGEAVITIFGKSADLGPDRARDTTAQIIKRRFDELYVQVLV